MKEQSQITKPTQLSPGARQSFPMNGIFDILLSRE